MATIFEAFDTDNNAYQVVKAFPGSGYRINRQTWTGSAYQSPERWTDKCFRTISDAKAYIEENMTHREPR